MWHGLEWFELLFPHLSGLVVDRVEQVGGKLVLWAAAGGTLAACPWCQTVSGRTHGGYSRSVSDVPVSGRAVVSRLRIRRFKCIDPGCRAVTFAEQIPEVTSPFSRYTAALSAWWEQIGLALAGRPGARLAGRLGATASRQTLLRRVMALPDPRPQAALEICGIDDLALRKGHHYGTVLVNLGTNRLVDLLPERAAGPVADWLLEHGADTVVICRDRAAAYAEAARTAAPHAIQVADRWHLWHNLCTAAGKDVAAHHGCMKPRQPVPDQPRPVSADEGPRLLAPDSPRIANTTARFEQVRELADRGWSVTRIQRHLGLDPKTVRKYANATSVDELLATAAPATSLDPYRREAAGLWNSGVTDAAAIHRRLAELGYTGSRRTVRRMLEPHRWHSEPMPTQIPAAKPAQLTRWITMHPDALTSEEGETVAEMDRRCPHLAELRERVAAFATMLTRRTGNEDLDAWIEATVAGGHRAAASFARGLRDDYDAILAGLTLPYSSGPVESNVTRIKAIKRQMCGRWIPAPAQAGPPQLLRPLMEEPEHGNRAAGDRPTPLSCQTRSRSGVPLKMDRAPILHRTAGRPSYRMTERSGTRHGDGDPGRSD